MKTEKACLIFGRVSFQPPTVVEVDRFPSGSITLNKDPVGEHSIWKPFAVRIYITLAFDVNASPVVLICNVLGTRENSEAIRFLLSKLVHF